MNRDMIFYFKERANEYEKIYSKPERQNELTTASDILQKIFEDKEVLEIACGTGYWTERIAKAARSVLATDINDAVINIARDKNYERANVSFERVDIFNNHITKKYETLFAGFLWSHIPLQEVDHFLKVVNEFVQPAGTVVFMDNNFVPTSSIPITFKDELGNTYQSRVLENNTEHLILKNFPSEKYLLDKLQHVRTNVNFINLEYYWILTYQTK